MAEIDIIYDQMRELGYLSEKKNHKSERYGHWVILWHSISHTDVPCCSECGEIADDQYNYCPNCGAKMIK